MFLAKVALSSSLELKHRLFSITSHTVEVLEFRFEVSSGRRHKGSEISLYMMQEAKDSLVFSFS